MKFSAALGMTFPFTKIKIVTQGELATLTGQGKDGL